MIRILLKRKYLYDVSTKDNVWETHYRHTYLDIGYKGKGNCGQLYFLTIIQEDYVEMFACAYLVWHSPF